jgi:formate dehydrogenase subunit beta
MDSLAEYLIKVDDFPILLRTLLKEKYVDKVLGAATKVDKKTNQEDRFTVSPVVYEKEDDIKTFPLTNLIAYGYARTDSAAKYLHKTLEGALKDKVAIIARPCDTRALIELAKIRQVNLENLFIIAFEDRGMIPSASKDIKKIKDIDPTKVVKEKIGDNGLIVKLDDGKVKEVPINIAENCSRCTRKIPVVADIGITDLVIPIDSDEIILKVYSEKGNELIEKSKISTKPLPNDIKQNLVDKIKEIKNAALAKRAKDLEEWDKLSQAEKIERLQKCTGCGICIRACPVCYCVDCILQKKKKEKTIDNVTYQLTRIAHVADRCVECGNCDNNCPQNLPLSFYFQSLNEAFRKKFKYTSGESVEDIPFRSGKAIRQMELGKT